MFEGIPKAKPTKLGTMRVVDMETGRVVEERQNAGTLLPPKPDVCQECATGHAHDEPHNQQSLYYQMHFRARHGRWPTWTDAMAHCPDDVKARWRRELVALLNAKGLPVPNDLT